MSETVASVQITPLGTPLPSSWSIEALGSLSSKIGSGATPRGGAMAYLKRSSTAFIRSQNVFDHRFSETGLVFIGDEAAEKLASAEVRPNDVLLNITGDGHTIARCCVVPDAILPARVSQHVVIIRAGSRLVPQYLQRYLSLPSIRRYMLNHNSGGSRRALTKGQIENFKVVLPPIKYQRNIVEALGALDDKIAANSNLANIADQWVRARLDQVFANATEATLVGDLVAQRKVQVDPSEVEPTLPYVGLEHIPRRSMWLEERGTAVEVTSNKYRFVHGDILFGKLRPYFHKVVFAPVDGICSTDILVLQSHESALSGIALAIAASDRVIRGVIAASEGTRMPRTSWRDLASIEVPWPGREAALAFSAEVSTLQQAVISHLHENTTLTATRDALLPQLMSGALRVKDAEKAIEEVV